MKLPQPKMKMPYILISGIYLLFSLLGCVFYFVLPPVLCSTGARMHTYLLIDAALNKNPSIGQILIVIGANLFVFAMIVLGLISIFKGPSRLYCLMVMTDIVLCLIFLLVQKTEEYNHTQGILLNILYCAWLLRLVTPRKRRSAPRPAGHTK